VRYEQQIQRILMMSRHTGGYSGGYAAIHPYMPYCNTWPFFLRHRFTGLVPFFPNHFMRLLPRGNFVPDVKQWSSYVNPAAHARAISGAPLRVR
jgi:hypothetical protein